MIRALGTILLLLLIAFLAGWWSAWHNDIFFGWLGGVGEYWSSVIAHDCRPPQGYTCQLAPTATPLDKP